MGYDYDKKVSSLVRDLGRKTKEPLPKRKLLIWLMGYPGAGSDSTINMIERATGQSMATNYGDVLQTKNRQVHKRVYESTWLQKEWYKEGAFVNNVEMPADTDEVYVKTFCTGYCLYEPGSGWCSRIPYVRGLPSLGKFWTECSRGDINLPPRTKRWNKTYWKNRVKKVLVLVRNPLEIVASRFLVYARDNAGIKRARTGLLPFCEEVDRRYGNMKEMVHVKRSKWIKPYLENVDVPCWTEFYRIFIWYAHTYTIASRREKLVRYYEDFVNDRVKTAEEILKFAGLSRMEGREILPIGDDVNIMFTDEEKENISKFMQAIGKFQSDMWGRYFKRYF